MSRYLKCRVALLSLLVFSVAGCDQFTLDAGALEDDLSPSFSGIYTARTLTASDMLALSWNAPKNVGKDSDVSFEVYVQELDADESQTALGLTARQSQELNLGERTGRIISPTDLVNPMEKGRLLKVLADGEYTYEAHDVYPTSAYAFQVVAYSDGQTLGKDPNVLIASSGAIGHYQGCVDARAVSASEVRVEFEFPEEASTVTIYRDGQPVHVASDPDEFIFFDRDLNSEQLYKYSCEAKVGDVNYMGNEEYSVFTPDPLDGLDNFDGCLEATALDASRIKIDFEFPDAVDSMDIYRGGLKILTSQSASTVTVTDTGLSEGVTYTYECVANIGDESKAGDNKISVATLTSNPPTFSGITSATASGSNSVLVSWGVSTGVPAASFKIYGKPGSTLNFTADELLTTQTDSLSKVVPNIGDELQYTFGVLACSVSDQCSGHGVTAQVTLTDAGAPTTIGATAATLVDSEIVITAPYNYSDGAVAKRKVYQRTGATGGTDINNYTLVKTVAISSPYTNISSSITISSVSENTTYHFIVRDEDPSTNTNTNTSVVSISLGDLTAPSFPLGIQQLITGSAGNEETELIAKFTAIVDETTDPVNGASHYVVYVKNGGGDACASGTQFTSLDATAYTSGTLYGVPITGLSARGTYSVCIKARDSTGNFSNTTTYLSKQTLDTTAPDFDGIQSITYNSGTSKFDVVWNGSVTSDIDEYKVQIWKNTPNPGGTTEIRKDHASFSSGFSFNTTTFTYAENDEIYVIVDACDDGDTIVDGSENCTSTAYGAALSATVPDVTAPPGFNGIASTSSDSEGEITYNWNPPASWADYAGFYLYTVDTSDDSLTQVKNCPCTDNDCSTNNLTSCTWTLGDANRTYRAHVRAYDLTGNITSYVNPATSFIDQLTMDSTAPSMSGTPTAALNGSDIDVSWNAATDNQYTGAGATISYKVWRKTGSDFANTNNPIADADGGAAISTVTTTTYKDTSVTDGQTYYYVICAQDAYTTPNITCSPSKDFYVDDITPPTITGVSTSYTNDQYTDFQVTWTIDDNESADGDIMVNIYKQISDDPSDFPLATGTYLDATASGLGKESITVSSADFSYYNYIIIAVDQANNSSTSTQLAVLAGHPAISTSNLLASFDAGFYGETTFPQSASSWFDLSENGYNGTLSGGTTWAGSGTASDPHRLNFDGNNGKVDFGTPLNGQSQMMVQAWVRPDDTSDIDGILLSNGGGDGDGFSLQKSYQNGVNLVVGEGYGFPSLVMSDNPIAYWRLSESSGTTVYDMTGTHNGTLVDMSGLFVYSVAGFFTGTTDKAMYFRSDDRVDFADHADFHMSDEATVEMYINIGYAGHTPNLFIIPGALSLTAKSTPTIQFNVTTASGTTTAESASAHDTWYHLVAVWDRNLSSDRLKLYINGSLAASADGYDEALSIPSGGPKISSKSGYHWRTIDEVAVYSSAFSAADVSAHYAAKLSCEATNVLEADKYSFVSGQWDGTTSKVYVNGREVCSYAPAAPTFAGSANMTAGSTSTGTKAFSGDISQIQVYPSGSATTAKLNFDRAADKYREKPLHNMASDNLILQLDAANSVKGMSASADDSCDNSELWFDISGSKKDGTITNFSSCGDSTGWNGDGSTSDAYRLSFDGVDDYVSVDDGSTLNPSTDITIEAWIYPTTSSTPQIIVNKSASATEVDYDLRLESLNVKFGFKNSAGSWQTVTSAGQVSLNTWNHIAGTFDGSTLRVYINAAADGSAASAETMPNTAGNLFVGANSSGGGDLFTGGIGYVSIHNTELDVTSLSQNCNALENRYTASDDICN